MAEASSAPKEFLECGLCYENDDLKRLPCSPGHVYCVTCLTKDTAETQIVQCPQCRTVFEEGVDSIPSAEDHLLDKFLCCDVCIRKEDKLKLAQIYCVICKKKFCDTHMQAHNMSLDDHERITMTEYQKEYRRLEMRFCAQHTQNIYSVGCQSCCKAFCVECMIKPGNCSDGSSHDLMPLEGLTQELIRVIKEKKVWIFDREESLLGIIKQLTRIISDWDTETEEMITKLHEARDKHIDEIWSKYDALEVKLVELRERSKTEVNQFLDDEVGVNLNKLTRQVKILDNRIYTHHQVDVLESYKDTERLVEELINMKIPEYKASDNNVILAHKDIKMEIKVEIKTSTVPQVTIPQLLLQPNIKLPTSMELLREVDVPACPVSSSTTASSGWGNLFAGAAPKWSCGTCLKQNDMDKKDCAACGTNNPTSSSSREVKAAPKHVSEGFGDLFKSMAEKWSCSVCLVKNDKDKTECVTCNAKRTSSDSSTTSSTAQPTAVSTTPAPSKGSGWGNLFQGAAKKWSCPDCLTQNDIDVPACAACGHKNPSGKAPAASQPVLSAPKPAVTSGWGDMFKKPEGQWNCEACRVSNPADKDVCVACTTPKPSKSVAFSKTVADLTGTAAAGWSKAGSPSSKLTGSWGSSLTSTTKWECSSCFVQNNSYVSLCACCGACKPVTISSLGDLSKGKQLPEYKAKKADTALIFGTPKLAGSQAITTASPAVSVPGSNTAQALSSSIFGSAKPTPTTKAQSSTETKPPTSAGTAQGLSSAIFASVKPAATTGQTTSAKGVPTNSLMFPTLLTVSKTADKPAVSTEKVTQPASSASAPVNVMFGGALPAYLAPKTGLFSFGKAVDTKAAKTAKKEEATPKTASGQWNCEACRVSNPADKDVCVACTTPKPSKSVAFSKTVADLTGTAAAGWSKAGSPSSKLTRSWWSSLTSTTKWKCSSCFVQNNSSVSLCACCGACKPGTQSSLGDLSKGKQLPEYKAKKADTALIFGTPKLAGSQAITTASPAVSVPGSNTAQALSSSIFGSAKSTPTTKAQSSTETKPPTSAGTAQGLSSAIFASVKPAATTGQTTSAKGVPTNSFMFPTLPTVSKTADKPAVSTEKFTQPASSTSAPVNVMFGGAPPANPAPKTGLFSFGKAVDTKAAETAKKEEATPKTASGGLFQGFAGSRDLFGAKPVQASNPTDTQAAAPAGGGAFSVRSSQPARTMKKAVRRIKK